MAEKQTFKLTPAIASEFGQINAQRKALEKMEKKLSISIKSIIKTIPGINKDSSEGTNGTIITYSYNPDTSPYELVYSELSITDVSWSAEFEKLYTKVYGKEAYAKFINKLPLKDSEKLEVKPNPYYVSEVRS